MKNIFSSVICSSILPPGTNARLLSIFLIVFAFTGCAMKNFIKDTSVASSLGSHENGYVDVFQIGLNHSLINNKSFAFCDSLSFSIYRDEDHKEVISSGLSSSFDEDQIGWNIKRVELAPGDYNIMLNGFDNSYRYKFQVTKGEVVVIYIDMIAKVKNIFAKGGWLESFDINSEGEWLIEYKFSEVARITHHSVDILKTKNELYNLMEDKNCFLQNYAIRYLAFIGDETDISALRKLAESDPREKPYVKTAVKLIQKRSKDNAKIKVKQVSATFFNTLVNM